MVAITYKNRPHRKLISPTHFLSTFLLCILSFYAGTLNSIRETNCNPVSNSNLEVNNEQIESKVRERLKEEWAKKEGDISYDNTSTEKQQPMKDIARFPDTISQYMSGAVSIDKDDFVSKFDYGIPTDKGSNHNSQVLLFYNTPKSLPTKDSIRKVAQMETGHGLEPVPVDQATENCDTMNIINLSNPGNTRQCLAVVGNYESYHVQRWMRVGERGPIDASKPLRAVSRGHLSNGNQEFTPPKLEMVRKHWDVLKKYFESIDRTIEKLKPLTELTAKDNTIVVMTCNMGQSELLVNFVCNSKAKGLPIDNVLVFPTDEETKKLAEGLGLTTYYHEEIFSGLPQGEAKHYGDSTFVAMMFAKIVCVQLINYMGYDLLFQDVDVVWNKNPLDFFHDRNNPFHDFDMYFQDDGAHSTRFGPLSANSGFYYVRNNDRTKYLFTSLLYSADQMYEQHSHQSVMVQLMNEHMSLFGLRVKVLSRDMEEFPAGWHYHRKNKDYMMKVVKGEITPYVFHMSWTDNKDNKIKYFQQMGEWYLNDLCMGHTKDEIIGNTGLKSEDEIFEPCCLAEPNIICHYRDKPSKIPCKDSPPIDKGRPSFW